MIFAVEGHIEMIRNGLPRIEPCKPILIKTQTRRLNRGIYQVGKDYAVQRKRGAKAEPDIRIVMDRIWEDFDYISEEDAWAEGGYTPVRFESVFKKLNPMWNGDVRWVFEFHVIEVEETERLIKKLKKFTEVRLKTIRKAWRE